MGVQTPAAGTPSQQTLANVQILRLVAAVIVVFGHAQQELREMAGPTTLASWRPIPWGFGVDIFFVISGFIMYIVAGDSFGSLRASRRFLARRLERIAPLYWIFTSALLALTLLGFGSGGKPDWVQTLASYLFFPVHRADGAIRPILSVGWTLNYEMLFYVLFALAMLLPKRVGMAALSATLLTLVALAPLARQGPAFAVYWTDPIILEFAAGLLLGSLYKRQVRLSMLAAGAMAIGGFALAAATWPQAPRALVSGFPAALIVAAAALGPNPTRPGALQGALIAGGDASYALYLSHIFVINAVSLVWARAGLNAPLLFLGLTLAGSILIGALVRLGLEKPILSLMRKRRGQATDQRRREAKPERASSSASAYSVER
ncbi:acyltransferase family protein [Caulobacter endophyticus]|uniref:Acyltransferase 3 domain-containing protein n=1 Tax=Caulobacter endophyticus TaxID=2172652 RepID=A0A2T9JY04_9CAUL|nr:acyltransferase [Caulobacter endophyticus]PVM88513.1 hypothetical protein DDF67_13255 [Caulobacter endophyticus]